MSNLAGVIQSVLDGDLETAKAEIYMELDARSQAVIEQGTEFVMNSISDQINGVSDDH